MRSVYYNFPLLGVSLQGTNCSQEIYLPKPTQPTTNIQIDNVNFMASSILITTNTPSNLPNYLVVKCFADINDTTSKMVYIAIPITVLPSENTTKTDLDRIIEPSGSSMVNMTLNNYIKDGKSCVVTTDNNIITVTLDNDSGISINKHIGKSYYSQSNLSSFKPNQSVKGNKNAVLAKKELDWVMDCELLTEDGKKMENIELGSTAITISLFMMTMLISGVVYLWGPIIYEVSGMKSGINTSLQGNHNSVNLFIGINFSIVAFMLFTYGASKNSQMHSFAALILLLSYFAGTSGVLSKEEISNADHSWFAKTDDMFAFYLSLCSYIKGIPVPDVTGKTSGIAFMIMILILLVGIPTSLGVKNDISIIVNVLMFIIFVFITIITFFKMDALKAP